MKKINSIFVCLLIFVQIFSSNIFAFKKPDIFSENGCYIGYHVDSRFKQDQGNISVNEFTALFGKKPAIRGIFLMYKYTSYDWGLADILPDTKMYFDDGTETGKTYIQEIAEGGAIPMITWEPMHMKETAEFEPNGSIKKTVSSMIPDIISGSLDENFIRVWATALKNLNRPVIIRWGHEMNNGDSWYPWAKAKDPDSYKRAFKHIVDIFEQVGATKVYWLFAPNIINGSQTEKDIIDSYYPGDNYVDIVGMSGYNDLFTDTAHFNPVFKPTLSFLEKYNKPLFIAEMGCLPNNNKESFIKDMFWVLTTKDTEYYSLYHKVKGFVWFNVNKPEETTNHMINTSAADTKAFVDGIKDPYFLSNIPLKVSLIKVEKGGTHPTNDIPILTYINIENIPENAKSARLYLNGYDQNSQKTLSTTVSQYVFESSIWKGNGSYIGNSSGAGVSLSGLVIFKDSAGNQIIDLNKTFSFTLDTVIVPPPTPTDLTLTAYENLANKTVIYKAKNSITAQDAFAVGNTNNVTFNAGNNVNLKSGFKVEDGGKFTCAIDTSLKS